MKIKFTFSILLALFVIGEIQAKEKEPDWPASFSNISVKEAKGLMESGKVILIDVRTDGEVEKGIIEGAMQINYNSQHFSKLMGELDKNKNYIVYCAVGGRSKQAMLFMKKLKFKRVYNLAGGYYAWSEL